MRIELGVEFVNGSLFAGGDEQIVVWCKDNGAGSGDEQVKAFVTKDTTYKDYLHIAGIGKCKGAGRMAPGWTKFPICDGYFLSARLDDPKSGSQYGELYAEMLFYQHFVTRARNRLDAYKRRLNVHF